MSTERRSMYAGACVFIASLSFAYWSNQVYILERSEPMNDVLRTLWFCNELPGVVIRHFTVALSTDGNTPTGYELFNATVWTIVSLPVFFLVLSLLRFVKGIRHKQQSQ